MTGTDNVPIIRESRYGFRVVYGLPIHGLQHDTELPSQELFAMARRHRLVGLLYASGSSYKQEPWRCAAHGQALHSARLETEAERLFARIERSIPNSFLIKGPGLAAQAWPDPGLRAFDDLDFRCAHSDYGALCAAMEDSGYYPQTGTPRLRAHYWYFGWGISFIHPEGYHVEANHRIFPAYYPCPNKLDFANPMLFMKLKIGDSHLRIPSPSFHLLLACFHALWHGGERLAWFVDIAGLLTRHHTALDEAQALTRRNTFARRVLHTGCEIANRLFGPDLTTAFLNEAIPSVAERVLGSCEADQALDSKRRQSLHFGLMKTRERTAYILRRAAIPGDVDLRRWKLPAHLRLFYWLLRPLRVLLPR